MAEREGAPRGIALFKVFFATGANRGPFPASNNRRRSDASKNNPTSVNGSCAWWKVSAPWSISSSRRRLDFLDDCPLWTEGPFHFRRVAWGCALVRGRCARCVRPAPGGARDPPDLAGHPESSPKHARQELEKPCPPASARRRIDHDPSIDGGGCPDRIIAAKYSRHSEPVEQPFPKFPRAPKKRWPDDAAT